MTDKGNEITLVLGLARSGLAALRLLGREGVKVRAADENQDISLPEDLAGIDLRKGKLDISVLDGVSRMVISPGVPVDHPIVRGARETGVRVISELELAYNYVSAPVIAVTGTNGKSTTVSMIGAILEEAGKDVIVAGNVGIPFSSVAGDLGPEGYYVIEVSSFQLEAVDRFRPVCAGILNLTPDHHDRYGNLDDYYDTKKRIYANCRKEDRFFYNHDDSRCRSAAEEFPGTIIPFSSVGRIDRGVFLDGDSLVRILSDGSEEKVMERNDLGVVGLHNVENALSAIAAVECLGISAEACRRALSSFRGLRHRMEKIAEIRGVSFFNDSKATNVEAAVKSLIGLDRPVVLIAGGYNKGDDFSGLLEIVQKVRAVVTLGKAASLIEDVLAGKVETYRSASMEDAVGKAAGIAEEGDMVILSPACASFDMFDDFEHRGDVFAECVNDLKRSKD
ncbi:MAG: UDP-N-acetylmuramoyl-L-alanine--D-glutamate ligase [Candidatus Krumholzibacteria bacterium]|nr:UDP-N-acetylmuramoyl-L-alanine--D-glutamate ligase [Candidatus Krumholzibacteria bacterium]